MPNIARKLAEQRSGAEMSGATTQIETASVAAKIYMRENFLSEPIGVTTLSGDDFTDKLELFGLPLGFVPRTPFNQNIDLVILKNDSEDFEAFLRIYGGNLSNIQTRELLARIGFWGGTSSEKTIKSDFGGWKIDTSKYKYEPDKNSIYIRIPVNEDFSELVKKHSKKPEKDEFLGDLDMNKFDINDTGAINTGSVVSDSASVNTLTLTSIEDGRKQKNKIDTLSVQKAVFESTELDDSFSVTKGTLNADSVYSKTISEFGITGNLTSDIISVYDFSMSAGHTGFYGPDKWNIDGNLILENVTIDTPNVVIYSFLNAARGEDVFIDDTGLNYTTKTGIDSDLISATHITLRDQISSSLAQGGTGPTIIDIRPAGTSVLPDILLKGIDNGTIKIISKPLEDTSDTVDCKSIINSLGVDNITYNKESFSQNIICQYVYWQRLEKRINTKQCLIDGKSNCED